MDRHPIKRANQRLMEYTGLIFLCLIVLSLGQTVSDVLLSRLGSMIEGRYYPVLADMIVFEKDDNGNLRQVVKPAFSITEMKWEGDDLVMRGEMCKAEPYQIVRLEWTYGSPAGVFDLAQAIYPSWLTRPVGCQRWSQWRIVGARKATAETLYAVVTSEPQHGRWYVYQTLGPFHMPPKDLISDLPLALEVP